MNSLWNETWPRGDQLYGRISFFFNDMNIGTAGTIGELGLNVFCAQRSVISFEIPIAYKSSGDTFNNRSGNSDHYINPLAYP